MSTALRQEYAATLRLAIPVVGSQLGQISLGFVDTVMVGRLGPESLAGVALGSTLFFSISVVCMGVVMGVSPMVSQAFGAGNDEAIGRSTRQGLWMGLTLGIPAFLLIYNAGHLLRLIGQDPATVALTEGYLQAIAWGIFPFLWVAGLRSFVEGVSNPLPVTIATFVGLVCNVLFNYVLMGHPMRNSSLKYVASGRRRRLKISYFRNAPRTCTYPANRRKIEVYTSVLAHPVPTSPNAGKPHLPNIST